MLRCESALCPGHPFTLSHNLHVNLLALNRASASPSFASTTSSGVARRQYDSERFARPP